MFKPYPRKRLTPAQRIADRRRAAKALGRPLVATHPVHHHDFGKLVICMTEKNILNGSTIARIADGDIRVPSGIMDPFSSWQLADSSMQPMQDRAS